MTRLTRFAAAATLALLACGDDDDPAGPNAPLNGSLTAVVDGQQWTATTIAADYLGQIGALVIAGSDAAGLGIAFSVPTDDVGTFTVQTTPGMNATVTAGGVGWLAVAGTGSGTVTISTLTSSRAVGTFSFVLVADDAGTNPQARTVTSGQFDVTY
ncbi:MAG TPA: DUF6252 family protein [Gemmatimonadaceae bacterium]